MMSGSPSALCVLAFAPALSSASSASTLPLVAASVIGAMP